MSDLVLEALANSAEDLVVQATLVSATGSSSKKIGAKMLVGASGRLLGGVTIGGCIDAQVIEAGDALIAEGGRRLLDISLDDDEAWEIGLTCGGNIEVLMERVSPTDRADPTLTAHAAARDALDADRAAVVVTSLDGPRRSLVIDENGTRTGTLGDPASDDAVSAVASDVLSSASRSEVVTTPSGERRFFFERYAPPTTVVIVGAGQIAMSLTRFARELDMRTIVKIGRASCRERVETWDGDVSMDTTQATPST